MIKITDYRLPIKIIDFFTCITSFHNVIEIFKINLTLLCKQMLTSMDDIYCLLLFYVLLINMFVSTIIAQIDIYSETYFT